MGFLAFLLAADLAGPLNPGFSRVLLTLVLAALIVPVVRQSPDEPIAVRAVLLSASIWPLIATHLAGTPGATVDLLIVVAALAGGARIGRTTESARSLSLAALAVALAALVFVGVRHLPIIWNGFDVTALAISSAAGVISGAPVELSPTFAGVWVLLLYGILAGVVLAQGGWRHGSLVVRAGVLLIIALGVAVLYAAALPLVEAGLRNAAQALITPPTIHVFDPDQPSQMPPGRAATIGNVVLLLLLLLPAKWLLQPLPAAVPTSGKSRSALLAPLALLALIGADSLMARPAPAVPKGATIAFYQDGTIAFSRPEQGRYGLIQAGMYGGTERFLNLAGYQFKTVSGEDLPTALETIDALVVINLREPFSERDHQAIWDFVRRGGGLLVMGDHTDLFGIMAPLNHLLEPVGTRFIFDSAFPLRSHWQYTMETRPHPITTGVVDHRDLQIGTGGSLVLDNSKTRPVVIGRYAFSDLGNRLNDGQGGLLGDYRYQIGERLGDVVVVATAEVGAGRVVVFGDTSSFQILAVPQARAFLDGVFAYVGGGHESQSDVVLALFGLMFCTGVIGILWLQRGRGAVLLIALLTLAAEATHDLMPTRQPATLDPGTVALIDTTHVPRAPYEFFTEGSIGGLFTALYRGGYLPVTGEIGDGDLVDEADLIVIFAPAEPYTSDDGKVLAGFLDRGGTLLIVADGGDPTVVDVPLDVCGLTLERIPLGPATSPWEGEEVELVDAWPVTPSGEHPAVVHAAWEGYGLIVETRPGPGRCLAVGDPRFFHDRNFEDERQFHPVNVPFVDALLTGGP